MTTIFDDDCRRKLASRAALIHERAQLLREDASTSSLNSAVNFDDWRAVFPDEKSFEHRLLNLDTGKADPRRVLDDLQWPADRPLPEWIDKLEHLLQRGIARYTTRGDFLNDPPGDGRLNGKWVSECAFGPVATGLAGAALATEERPAVRAVSDNLFDELVRWYTEAFEFRFGLLLTSEFSGNVPEKDRTSESEELYQEYLTFLFEGGLADLCRSYPVFARFLTTHVHRWATQATRFCRRYLDDRERLTEVCGSDVDLGSVSGLSLPGEPSVTGRPTLIIKFDSGKRVVYKNRSVEADEYFYEALDNLTQRAGVPEFELPTVLSSDGYGWVEWVSATDCSDEAAVERYYRRAGALIAVCHFMCVEDCWEDNIVASGEHPVVVDAESVLTPRTCLTSERQTTLPDFAEGTILSTGLLPIPTDNEDRRLTRRSAARAGIGASSNPVQIDEETHQIENVSTDAINVSERLRVVRRDRNVATLAGEDQPPAQYAEQITEGFERIYREVLASHRCGESPLPLPDERPEFETRVTSAFPYDSVLESLTTPLSLRSGSRAGLRLEQLATVLNRDSNDVHWEFFQTVCESLGRLDQPPLSVRPGRHVLSVGSNEIEGLVIESGLGRAFRRATQSSMTDLDDQITLLKRAVSTAWPHRPRDR